MKWCKCAGQWPLGIVAFLALALALPSAVRAGKPGGSAPLPNVKFALRFIGSADVQPTGGVSQITDAPSATLGGADGYVVGNALFSDGTRGPYLFRLGTGHLIQLQSWISNSTFLDSGGNRHTRYLDTVYTPQEHSAHVNKWGCVVGTAEVHVTDPVTQAFLYRYFEGSLLTPNPPDVAGNTWYTYQGLGDFTPTAINDEEITPVVTGCGVDGATVVVCRAPGIVEVVGKFNGGYSRPNGITTANAEGDFHILGGGWIWHPNSFDIPTDPANGTWTQPAISSKRSGLLAGQVNDATFNSSGQLVAVGCAGGRAFVTTEGGVTEDLGNFTNRTSNSWDFTSGYANGIGFVAGQRWVVGESYLGDGTKHRAFLYINSTYGLINLDKLIDPNTTSPADYSLWNSSTTNTQAKGVNSAGCISGQGSFGGVHRAFVLIPVFGN